MTRYLLPLIVISSFVVATPANAQTIGTFRWNVAPFCNVLNLTVTQHGSVYALHGFEEQCGGNPRLPVYGVAIMQPNGTIWFGLTTIFDFGNGLHTQVTMLSDFSGTWRDNANQNGTWVFNPATTTGGPRITPIEPIATLKAEVAELKQQVAALLARDR